MKLQGLAIIFAIVVVPIVIVLSAFIQSQVNTIALQTAYDTKLLDATHDAMSSFEINTANEDLSSVADSLRSIIQASNNVFLNTLSTNLGMSNASKSYLQPYLPAILYTLYDGYYIYAPTRVPVVKVGTYQIEDDSGNISTEESDENGYFHVGTAMYDDATGVDLLYELDEFKSPVANPAAIQTLADGSKVTTDVRDARYIVDYVLKSYIPYSARYKNGDIDVTINYTLDNYITVSGNVGNSNNVTTGNKDIYYTKSGYLVNPNMVKIKGTDAGGTDIKLDSYNEVEAEEMCLSGYYNVEVSIDETNDGIDNGISIKMNADPDFNIAQKEERLKKVYEILHENNWSKRLDVDGVTELYNPTSDLEEMRKLEHDIEIAKAVTYYVKANIFSQWVYNRLGTVIQEKHIQEEYLETMKKTYISKNSKNNESLYYDFAASLSLIFDQTNDPTRYDSVFNNHRVEVIKSSIQYNLNLAMSSYNQMSFNNFSFNMPIISETEWDKITSNISIVSFMQGFKCGFKTYNNYSIVSSTNNEMTVIPEEIYYTKKEEFNNGESAYHRIDCPLLETKDADGNPSDMVSFKSTQFKYDKIYNMAYKKYQYDHRNLACYNCIVGSSFERDTVTAGYDGYGNSGELRHVTPALAESEILLKERGVGRGIDIDRLGDLWRKLYYIGTGSERQGLYKFNAIKESIGYETFSSLSVDDSLPASGISTYNIGQVKELQITISETEYDNHSIAVAKCNVRFGGDNYGDFTINLHQNKPQTIYVPVTKKAIEEPYDGGKTGIDLNMTNPSDVNVPKILSVKVVYK